jgi:hypothetical protein
MEPVCDQDERIREQKKTYILSPSHVNAAALPSVSGFCKDGPPEAIATGR